MIIAISCAIAALMTIFAAVVALDSCLQRCCF